VSAATKEAIQAALEAHLSDEGMLRDGELVTDWLLLAAALPEARTEAADGIYVVVAAEHMMSHHCQGLASWYLFDRNSTERE
jgi:hypothetical protein